jgi:hypothetical protein
MTTFTKLSKAATSFAKGAKAAVEYVKAGFRSFLLKEDGAYLLLEGGGRFIFTETNGGRTATVYTKTPK